MDLNEEKIMLGGSGVFDSEARCKWRPRKHPNVSLSMGFAAQFSHLQCCGLSSKLQDPKSESECCMIWNGPLVPFANKFGPDAE